MRNVARRTVAVGLAVALASLLTPSTPAAAVDRTFTLYGDATLGWGFTNTSFSIPGPTITVDEGDNVTFVLTSADGVRHNWFIDYDNDTNDDGNEPDAPDFRTSTVTWNFTADRQGTFVYRCRYHPAEMWGTIVFSPPGTTPPPGSSSLDLTLAMGLVVGVVALLGVSVAVARRKKPA